MYDYRRMTAAERLAVVEERRSRGYPLHKPAHPDGPGWYFITAATFEHRLHFAAPRELTALQYRLLEALRDGNFPCAGWVVLPNHYHLVIEAHDLALVGKALGLVHGRSAHYANTRDGCRGRRVWYKFNDRRIRSERHFWTCLHYVVNNPVKHGYVEDAKDWPWSCRADLLREHGELWLEDLAQRYPLLDFGKDWDV